MGGRGGLEAAVRMDVPHTPKTVSSRLGSAREWQNNGAVPEALLGKGTAIFEDRPTGQSEDEGFRRAYSLCRGEAENTQNETTIQIPAGTLPVQIDVDPRERNCSQANTDLHFRKALLEGLNGLGRICRYAQLLRAQVDNDGLCHSRREGREWNVRRVPSSSPRQTWGIDGKRTGRACRPAEGALHLLPMFRPPPLVPQRVMTRDTPSKYFACSHSSRREDWEPAQTHGSCVVAGIGPAGGGTAGGTADDTTDGTPAANCGF